MTSSPSIRFIDEETATRLLDFPSLIEALRAGHKAGIDEQGRMLLEQSSRNGANDHFLVLAAWQRQQALGIKLVTVFPDNAARNTPTIASVYVLFDGIDGRPLAVIDATPLTVRKTGADSALGADYLARQDVRTLLMVGAGKQAPFMIEAHRTVRPGIDRILIWNRTADRAHALADQVRNTGASAEAVTDLQAAARTADIICCATASTSPILRGEWIRPGTHVDLVGGFTPDMREADDDVIRRARVFVDSRWLTLNDAGDICQPLRQGIITEADIEGDLFQLACGTVLPRQSPDEITVFKNAGGGHLDLMAARLAYDRSR
jgi:ornithine cyclodeaminase